MFEETVTLLMDNADIEVYTANQEISLAGNNDDDCIAKYGVSKDTVIFYHADWCPHCQKMKPIVEELSSEYNFLAVETSSGDNIEVMECFYDKMESQGVPQFICAGTGEIVVGEMPKEKLVSFAKKCEA